MKYDLKRGWFWLMLAIAGAVALLFGADATQYVWSWLGILVKAASGTWFGYWVSKDILRIDPSAIDDARERAEARKSRALVVASCIVAFCLGV